MASVVAVTAATQQRKKKNKKKRIVAKQSAFDDHFSHFDLSKSWEDDEDLKQVLQKVLKLDHEVSDEALKFVKETADHSKNGTIETTELKSAIQAYVAYIDNKETVRLFFFLASQAKSN